MFASSIAVYGSAQVPFHEDTTPRPEDPYGIAKFAFELDLEAASRLFGQRYAILRPHNVYGEGQNIFDRYRNVAGIFIGHASQGRPLPIFGNGTQSRGFSHVEDVARAFVHAAVLPGAWGRPINVGSDDVVSVNELARLVSDAMGAPLQTEHLQERNEVLHAIAEHSLQKEVFGHLAAPVSLADGLKGMAQWAKRERKARRKELKQSNGQGYSSAPPIEVNRELPPSWTT